MRSYKFPGCSLILLLMVICCAQALKGQAQISDYSTEWKKIDDLVNKGLTKSALESVDKIYRSAKKTGNEAQVIKSLLFKMKFRQNLEENASEKSIDTLEIEIATAKEPAKSILENIAAQVYLNYFQQNRYKLYSRTNTVNFNKKDIATWTADELNKKTGELYLASLKNESLLQQTKLDPFDAILIKGNARFLRPTLYDLLAHRALDYFKSDESNITRPAYAFEIKEKEAFSAASDFIKYKFTTKDSTSLHHKAILIFQELLNFHASDGQPGAVIDADIERLNFIYQYAVADNKDSLYIKALQDISEKYNTAPASAQSAFLAAQMIYNAAFQASKNEGVLSGYTVKQAKEKLGEIAKKFPDSEGGINSRNLINQILHPEINLTTEKINVPGQPFRTLITYKNFNSAYFRILQLTPELKKQVTDNYDNDKVFPRLINEKSLAAWKQELPQADDYLSHSTEIKIDALAAGEYVLLGSALADFSLDKNPLAAQYFYVSDISYLNSGSQYFILNRTTGQPLAGAKVQVWKQQNSSNTGDNKLIKQEQLVADKNGYCKLGVPKKDDVNKNVRLEITYKKDRLFLDNLQYIYNYYNDEDDTYDDQKDYDEYNAKVFLFTDRSIYRPGQLVYFKGIGVTKDWKTKKPRYSKQKIH